ncbi:MAG: hypothetical protein Q9195_009560, partial [Heterodermia aff. obscurata]
MSGVAGTQTTGVQPATNVQGAITCCCYSASVMLSGCDLHSEAAVSPHVSFDLCGDTLNASQTYKYNNYPCNISSGGVCVNHLQELKKMATITVNGNTIDPEDTNRVSRDAKSSNFIYIQCYHDLSIDEKRQMNDMGVEIQEYVAEYTYLCRYLPEDLEQIRALSFVRTANIYEAELKSTISLKDAVEREADREEYQVDLILHTESSLDSSALAPHVADRAGVDLNELQILPNKIRLNVHQDRLQDLAALDSVNRIEEVRSKSMYNDVARGILQADALFTSTGYQGAGQIICVADTGFDQGIAEDTSEVKVHPAFTGRVERLVALWHPGNAKDPVGHGTHVSGSVCGSGTYTDSVQGKDISVKGTAPAAKLMMQSMSRYSETSKSWKFEAPAALSTLFSVPYDLGIRIHNNSWGDTWDAKTGQLGYEADATEIDKFICTHQDFVILIAAGNDADKKNHGISQIGDNSAAKNCITVGATGTTRPNDNGYYDAKVAARSGWGSTDTAVFSSRGPTKSTLDSANRAVPGRIKPDVVAPGVVILSAASRSVAAADRVRTRFGPSSDTDWLFMSGTSMATPLVAGCAALIREALHEHGKQYASAALVKALLVNGAVNYSSPPGGPGFDAEQGFGRVDIDNSIAMIRQSAFMDGGSHPQVSKYDTDALRVNAEVRRRWESPPIPFPSSGRRGLAATLVYPDPPGALLQNDVNLVVRVGEEERHGNMGAGMGFDHT